jgi:Zn-dependent protease with chaperone function
MARACASMMVALRSIMVDALLNKNPLNCMALWIQLPVLSVISMILFRALSKSSESDADDRPGS